MRAYDASKVGACGASDGCGPGDRRLRPPALLGSHRRLSRGPVASTRRGYCGGDCTKRDFDRRRAVELKHGRICMFATIGALAEAGFMGRSWTADGPEHDVWLPSKACSGLMCWGLSVSASHNEAPAQVRQVRWLPVTLRKLEPGLTWPHVVQMRPGSSRTCPRAWRPSARPVTGLQNLEPEIRCLWRAGRRSCCWQGSLRPSSSRSGTHGPPVIGVWGLQFAKPVKGEIFQLRA